MLVSAECPECNGNGEVCGVNPNRRSRFVGMDDLSPDDFTVNCPRCLGKGVVDYDPTDEIEDWMRKYIDYLDRCTGGTWQRYQLEQMASVAADSWMDDDPEEIASSDLHCMRSDAE